MWNVRMYEWMANERIAQYQREAERGRQLRSAAAEPRPGTPPAAVTAPPTRRRAVAAAVLGLAAMGVLRRRP